MAKGKIIITRLVELIKSTKIGECGMIKIPQEDWNKLEYEEKAIIHKLIDKYAMTMIFKDNLVYITYDNIEMLV